MLAAWWLRPLGLPLGMQATLLLGATIIGTAAFCLVTAQIGWLRPWAGYGPIKPAAVPAPLRA